jgi:hypothetical protein
MKTYHQKWLTGGHALARARVTSQTGNLHEFRAKASVGQENMGTVRHSVAVKLDIPACRGSGTWWHAPVEVPTLHTLVHISDKRKQYVHALHARGTGHSFLGRFSLQKFCVCSGR